jgi:hypothetical protein
MARLVEIETTILEEMPVKVYGRIHRAEPDVGYAGGAEIDEIEWANGKPIRRGVWRRLSNAEIKRIEEEIIYGQD